MGRGRTCALLTGFVLAGCSASPGLSVQAVNEAIRLEKTDRLRVGGKAYVAEQSPSLTAFPSPPGVVAEGLVPRTAVSRDSGGPFLNTPGDRDEATKVAKAFCRSLGFKWRPRETAKAFYIKEKAEQVITSHPVGRPDLASPAFKFPAENAEWAFPEHCVPTGYLRQDERGS